MDIINPLRLSNKPLGHFWTHFILLRNLTETSRTLHCTVAEPLHSHCTVAQSCTVETHSRAQSMHSPIGKRTVNRTVWNLPEDSFLITQDSYVTFSRLLSVEYIKANFRPKESISFFFFSPHLLTHPTPYLYLPPLLAFPQHLSRPPLPSFAHTPHPHSTYPFYFSFLRIGSL